MEIILKENRLLLQVFLSLLFNYLFAINPNQTLFVELKEISEFKYRGVCNNIVLMNVVMDS